MSPVALNLAGLDVFWGPAQAVFRATLALQAGEAVALLGRNGAGKSSLLLGLAGWAAHQAESIEVLGQDLRHWPCHQRARAGLALVPQERRIFTDLTVRENLMMGAQARGPRPDWVPRFDMDELLELFGSLKPRLHHWGAQLSGGEQQMLAIARALMSHPTVLLLDEPTEGLAPKVIDALEMALLALRRQGVCVLLAEQHQGFAQRVCDRSIWLQDGHCQDSDETPQP